MIYKILLFIFLLQFNGCSFKTPQNKWQFKSVNAFSAYTKNFLSAKDTLAKDDLKRAVNHAKQSANLSQLARIYLGECALNISVGLKDNCYKYNEITDIIKDKKLDAYNQLLHLNISNSKLLPIDYQNYGNYIIKNDFKNAQNEILKMQNDTSKLLAASLIKNKIDNDFKEKILGIASFNGYKKAVLFWLKEIKRTTKDKRKKEKISKKISILIKYEH